MKKSVEIDIVRISGRYFLLVTIAALYTTKITRNKLGIEQKSKNSGTGTY